MLDIKKALIKNIQTISQNAKCPKRKVGAIVTDIEYNILAGSSNQTVSNHCDCNIYSEFKGSRNNNCLAIHAEVAAIINALEIKAMDSMLTDLHAIFTTCSPCINCAKVIAFSGIKEVYYIEEYCNESIRYLINHNIICIKVEKI